MKKIIFSLICLFIPFIVYADMGSPMITNYDVRVTNPLGLKAINTDGGNIINIPYDTTLTIVYEFYENKTLKGEAIYNEDYYIIELDNTEILKKEINLEDFKQEEKITSLVIGNGADLYQGPSKLYGKINGAHIPAGTIISYEYYDEVWAYVTYNDFKGWVYSYYFDDYFNIYEDEIPKTLAEADHGTFYTIKDIQIYDDPIFKNKTFTIPKGEEVEYYYMYNHESIYINYNNKTGWYFLEDLLASKSSGEIITLEPLSIYEEPNNNSNILKNIPIETEVFYDIAAYPLYFYGDNEIIPWYYVDYEGIKGWISSTYSEYGIVDAHYYEGNVLEEGDIYNSINGEVIGNLKENDIVNVKYEFNNNYYIYTDEINGWYKGKIKYIKDIDKSDIKPNKPSIVKPINPPQEEEKKEPIKEEEIKEEKINRSIKDYALMAIISSLVLALVIFVIIKLVNKRKEELK